jgi:hypothetical protein
MKAQMLHLRSKGVSIRKVAELLGVNRGVVQRYDRKHHHHHSITTPLVPSSTNHKHDDVITLSNQEDIREYEGKRYRLFKNLSQAHIYHYIFDQRDCDKVRIGGKWYVEIKPHACRLHCQDSGE